MKIGLYSNLTRDLNAVYTKAVYNILKERKVIINISNDLKDVDFGYNHEVSYGNYDLARLSDVVIVLGGDGTILGIAKECATFNTPIFAVNMGHKGFLSEVNKEDLEQDFNDLFNGNFMLDKRKFLKVNVQNDDNDYYALNEVVVAQSLCSRIIKAEITVNGTMVDKYTSDGIIVATPTGSTAYSLSAGGPIVAPDVSCFIISPICAHSLHSRPLIVASSSSVGVTLLDAIPGANINIDGEHVKTISNGTTIKVSDSDLCVSFIRRKTFNFYEKLLEKMRYWSSIEI